ncbi:hypothetical protein DMUE_3469 [Dictyocoela muelleri]|nr:hypothetical protein DMUE_3469 [Dictyocoela muelleri]
MKKSFFATITTRLHHNELLFFIITFDNTLLTNDWKSFLFEWSLIARDQLTIVFLFDNIGQITENSRFSHFKFFINSLPRTMLAIGLSNIKKMSSISLPLYLIDTLEDL